MNTENKYKTFIESIEKEKKDDDFTFLYVADVHYRRVEPPFPAYYKLQSMVDFTNYFNADLIALGGDIVNGYNTLDKHCQDVLDVANLLKKSKVDKYLINKGNHDECSWYAYNNALPKTQIMSNEEWFYHTHGILGKKDIIVNPKEPYGGYYYIDYPIKKIRVINVNTSDFPYDEKGVFDTDGKYPKNRYCPLWVFGIRQKQIEWLVNALTIKERGWSVMIMTHNFFLPYEGEIESDFVKNGDCVWQILKDFRDGKKGYFKGGEKYHQIDISYDFTQNKSFDLLPIMFGHCHKDLVLKVDGITAISVKDLLNASNDIEDDGGWDYFIVDKTARVINSFRYGVLDKNIRIEY